MGEAKRRRQLDITFGSMPRATAEDFKYREILRRMAFAVEEQLQQVFDEVDRMERYFQYITVLLSTVPDDMYDERHYELSAKFTFMLSAWFTDEFRFWIETASDDLIKEAQNRFQAKSSDPDYWDIAPLSFSW